MVTSRPEARIMDKLEELKPWQLKEDSDENKADLRLYIAKYLDGEVPGAEGAHLAAGVRSLSVVAV